MPRDNKRDYKVGRGKPPLQTRFKPGQSGNPKGRPKGRRGLFALLRAELQTLINVTEDGQTKRMTKEQAIAKRLVNALLKGDSKAFALLARFALPDEERESSPAERPLSDREKQLLDDFMRAALRKKRR